MAIKLTVLNLVQVGCAYLGLKVEVLGDARCQVLADVLNINTQNPSKRRSCRFSQHECFDEPS